MANWESNVCKMVSLIIIIIIIIIIITIVVDVVARLFRKHLHKRDT